MEPEDTTKQDAEAVIAATRRAVDAIEAACLAEVQAVLARYGCALKGAPAPVGQGELWSIRWGVCYVPGKE